VRGFSDNLQALGGFYAGDGFRRMAGRPLAAVELSPDKSMVTFRFQDGGSQSFTVEGDCCSSSWIEHIEVPDRIAGAEITNVTEDMEEPGEVEGHECLKVYQTRFITSRGEIVLEYRNSSNGYYGGYLVDAAHEDPTTTAPEESGGRP